VRMSNLSEVRGESIVTKSYTPRGTSLSSKEVRWPPNFDKKTGTFVTILWAASAPGIRERVVSSNDLAGKGELSSRSKIHWEERTTKSPNRSLSIPNLGKGSFCLEMIAFSRIELIILFHSELTKRDSSRVRWKNKLLRILRMIWRAKR